VAEIVEASTSGQIEQVRNLFSEYRAQLPVEYRLPSLDTEIAGLPGVYSPPQGRLLLATVAGQPVGCVGLRPFPLDRACEMKRLYVRPAFRGGKLALALVERLISVARDIGYVSLRLDTHPPSMRAALEMYRRFGFHEVSAHPLEPLDGLMYMELSLV
jgi:GNAT superfamily N-acetyltransferase